MSALPSNGSDAGSKPSAANKQQFKSSNGPSNGKTLDGVRKLAASPVDGQARKHQSTPPPKAWQGVNPITQRASTPASANGSTHHHMKSNSQTVPTGSNPVKPSSEQHTDKHAHDRALFLLATFTGHDATVTLRNGEQFRGVFSGASLDTPAKLQYVLKMVKRARAAPQEQVNGNIQELSDEYIGDGDDHVMAFDKEDTIDLSVADVKPLAACVQKNGSIGSSFRTDTQISARDAVPARERELQRWEGGSTDPSMDLSLQNNGNTEWDQFAVNEKLYGVQSTYNEDLYTTTIDRSNPLYRQREADAARIAREIEVSTPADAHVAEERRRDAVGGGDEGDEEDKYSGVRRETALPKRTAGAYIPPSQRPITSTPTVPGAPFDPAIISSQLARPAPAASNTAAGGSSTPAVAPVPAVPLSTAVEPPSQSTPPTTGEQAPRKAAEPNPDDYMRDLTDSFKQFANSEKLRVRQAQEAKRWSARAEKNVRLNDLKKFSENFKLTSRVPDDLVPILAKDRDKQRLIQTKAERAALDEESRTKEKEREKDQEKEKDKEKMNGVSPAAATDSTQVSDGAASAQPRGSSHRPGASQQLPAAPIPSVSGANARRNGATPSAATPATQRHNRIPIESLPANLRDLHNPPVVQQPPAPTPAAAPAPAPSPEKSFSPTASQQKLNGKAAAFEFRPGARHFTPTGTSPSPQRFPSRPPVAASAAKFFTFKRPDDSAPPKDIQDDYCPLKALRQVEPIEEQKSIFAANGGIQKPYQTPPTWRVSEDSTDANTSFRDTLPKAPSAHQGLPHLAAPGLPHMAHGHQLPPHFQPHQQPMPGPSQRGGGHYGPPHHGQGGHQGFDHSRGMPQSFLPNGSVHSSPRFAPMPVASAAFSNQMPGGGPGGPYPGGPHGQLQHQQMSFVPGMSPSLAFRQMHMPDGRGMGMGPGQPGMPPMPSGPYPRGPSYPQPPMMPGGGGVPMANQPSSGFPGGPMSPMPPGGSQNYSPMPPHAQPHLSSQPQHPNGVGGPGHYAGSPRPGAHMMQHNQSQQHQQSHQPGYPPPSPMPHHHQQGTPVHHGHHNIPTHHSGPIPMQPQFSGAPPGQGIYAGQQPMGMHHHQQPQQQGMRYLQMTPRGGNAVLHMAQHGPQPGQMPPGQPQVQHASQALPPQQTQSQGPVAASPAMGAAAGGGNQSALAPGEEAK